MKPFNLTLPAILFFIFISINSSCQKKEAAINLISADSLNQIFNGDHGILLDVRTPEEFAEGHIPGAINIDYHNESFSTALDTLDKNLEYEVYCRSGKRSDETAKLMKQKGFTKIYHFKGGMLEWNEKNFKTEK